MEIKPGFASLFNGKDLKGWIGDPNFWKAENGIIVGRTTEQLDRNLFLWTEKEYSNFIFYSEVRLVNYPRINAEASCFNEGLLSDTEELPSPQASIRAIPALLRNVLVSLGRCRNVS